jgi:hypothetical protein
MRRPWPTGGFFARKKERRTFKYDLKIGLGNFQNCLKEIFHEETNDNILDCKLL